MKQNIKNIVLPITIKKNDNTALLEIKKMITLNQDEIIKEKLVHDSDVFEWYNEGILKMYKENTSSSSLVYEEFCKGSRLHRGLRGNEKEYNKKDIVPDMSAINNSKVLKAMCSRRKIKNPFWPSMKGRALSSMEVWFNLINSGINPCDKCLEDCAKKDNLNRLCFAQY